MMRTVLAGRGRTVVAAAVLATMLAGSARPVGAAEEDESRFATDFGYGVAAFFTNLVYMPTKFVYATFGGITGGMAYMLTGFNYPLARQIWIPSTGGDYVVTPSMLRGEDPIFFSGTTEPKRERSSREEEDLGTSSPKPAAAGKPASY
ncbi:MAG: hypothetical protein IT293_16555 [Deltaproteobacteria bacterium]|nr:hypothetical protein [Deltaproteobacteria bacterium]